MKISNTSLRLKEIMQNRKLKQIDILNACKLYEPECNVKIAKNDLSQYISGKVEPKQDKLSLLSRALNVNEVWLMGYDVLPNRDRINAPTSPDSLDDRHTTAIRIPVVGDVAAGIPIEAVENVLDYEEIPADMAKTGEFFGLKIKGNSMEPVIRENDVVIVRQQPDAESGDIVIVRINGNSAACKRLRKYADGALELISLNPSYEPMYFDREQVESEPVEIVGVVVENRQKYKNI